MSNEKFLLSPVVEGSGAPTTTSRKVVNVRGKQSKTPLKKYVGSAERSRASTNKERNKQKSLVKTPLRKNGGSVKPSSKNNQKNVIETTSQSREGSGAPITLSKEPINGKDKGIKTGIVDGSVMATVSRGVGRSKEPIKSARIKQYAGMRILDSRGEEARRNDRRIKRSRRHRKSGSDDILCGGKTLDSVSVEMPTKEFTISAHTSKHSDPKIRKINETKAFILRSYTDDIADDVRNRSTSVLEQYWNFDELVRSPVGETPVLKSTKVVEYSLYMRVMQEYRMRGASAIAFACVSAVSIDTVLRIPGLAQRNGGWYFLLAFYICLLFVVAPVACIEMALGQLTTQNGSGIFGTMAPAFAGLSFLMDIIRLLNSFHIRFNGSYPLVFVGLLWYLIHTEADYVCDKSSSYCYEYKPWCFHSIHQFDYSRSLSNTTVFFAEQCITPRYHIRSDNYVWIKNRLLTTEPPKEDIERTMTMHQDSIVVVLCFCLSVILFARKGVRSFYKISVLIMVLLIISLVVYATASFFECKYDCLGFGLHSDAAALLTPNVWATAMTSACTLIGIGDGTIHSIGMYMGFRNNFFKTTVCIVIYATVLIALSFVVVFFVTNAAFVEFGVRNLHEWSHKYYIILTPFRQNISPLQWLGMFMVICTLMLSQIPYHVISCDILHRRGTLASSYYAGMYSNLGYLYCLIFYGILVTACVAFLSMFDIGGDLNVITWNVISYVVFSENIILILVYGIDRFFVNLKSMLGRHKFFTRLQWFFPFVKVYIRFVVPICLLVSICASLLRSGMNTLSFASFAFVGMLFIIFAPIVRLLTRRLFFSFNITPSLRNAGRWGPSNMENRQTMYFDEKAARIYT